jgi:hypothetical protein
MHLPDGSRNSSTSRIADLLRDHAGIPATFSRESHHHDVCVDAPGFDCSREEDMPYATDMRVIFWRRASKRLYKLSLHESSGL